MRRSTAALGIGLALVVGTGLVVVLARAPQTPALAAQPEVSAVVARYRERWPGPHEPAAHWRAQARVAWAAGLGRKAARSLEQALAQEVTAEALAWLVAVSARWPALVDLGADERAALAALVADDHPGAAAWQDLARGDAGAALARLEATGADDLLSLSARVRAVQDLGGDPSAAALALHRAAPRDVEGCELAARAGLSQGDLSQADQVLATCRAERVDSPLLDRLAGDLLDLAGEPAEACGAWLRAGAELHAAAVLIQGGRCEPPAPADLVTRALAQDSPEARLHATWAAVLGGDPAAALAALEALRRGGDGRGPPFQAAAAAALLLAGRPEEARGAVEGLDDPASLILRARAAASPAEAIRLADLAVSAAPWSLPLRREQAALLADRDPAALEAALRSLSQADPVPFALAGLEPDRLVPARAVAPSPWPWASMPPWARAVAASLDPAAPPALGPAPDPLGLVARARLARSVLSAQALPPAALALQIQEARSGRPDDPVVAALAAVALSSTGQADQAAAALARAEATDPAAVATAWARANLALDAGDGPRARQLAAALVADHPGLPGLRAFRFAVEEQARSAALDGARGP